MDKDTARLLSNAADALRGLIALVEHELSGECTKNERKTLEELDRVLDEDGLAHTERVAEDGGIDFSVVELDGPVPPEEDDIPF